MLADMKMIPTSRIPPASNTSREFTDKILRELQTEGLINPLRTATGRGLLSFRELEIVWERLGR